MQRILTFHGKESLAGSPRLGATYYIEADYTPIAVRIYAKDAPTADAKIDIYDDGVSIFDNRTPRKLDQATGIVTIGTAVTSAILPKDQNSEEYAEDFDDETMDIIEQGSWVYCNLVDTGNGNNFTVHLELERASEDSEPER